MEKRALESVVRPVQREDIKTEDYTHTITFADYVEKLLRWYYSPTEKEYLNRIFLTRKDSLRIAGKNPNDPKERRKMILGLLAKDYEEFIFDVIKRRMEVQSEAANIRHKKKEEEEEETRRVSEG